MLEVPYRIPWLIWIQLIVLLLLLALLFFFTLDFSLDPDAGATVTVISPATASTSAKVFLFDEIEQIDKPVITTNHIITNSQRFTQGGENLTIKSEIRTDSSTSMRREEITEGEAPSLSFHLCHYFEWATVAFLKCFGLHSTSDTSSNRKHRKRKQS